MNGSDEQRNAKKVKKNDLSDEEKMNRLSAVQAQFCPYFCPSLRMLYEATVLGDRQAVIEAIGKVKKVFLDVSNRSPLNWAALYGFIEVAEVLLDYCEINHGDAYDTPLCCAAREGDIKMIRFLVRHGARIYNRGTPISHAIDVAIRHGQRQAVIELTNLSGARIAPSILSDPLHRAIVSGDAELVQALAASGANLNNLDFCFGRITPLERALNNNHPDVARSLIINGALCPARDERIASLFSNQPLVFAAIYNDYGALNALFDVRAQDDSNDVVQLGAHEVCESLTYAIGQGQRESALILIPHIVGRSGIHALRPALQFANMFLARRSSPEYGRWLGLKMALVQAFIRAYSFTTASLENGSYFGLLPQELRNLIAAMIIAPGLSQEKG